jgi:uncharacterized membrane protein YhaH (DUF805 family)
MARDGALPAGRALSRVSPTARTPMMPALVSGLIALAILLGNINKPQIFTVVTGVAIVLIYVAYLLVTVPLLRKRLNGWPDRGSEQPGLFSLGRWGVAVNVFAVAYGAFMAINIVWPRNEVYGAGNYMWGGLIFVGIVIVVGLLYYGLVERHRAPTYQEPLKEAFPLELGAP